MTTTSLKRGSGTGGLHLACCAAVLAVCLALLASPAAAQTPGDEAKVTAPLQATPATTAPEAAAPEKETAKEPAPAPTPAPKPAPKKPAKSKKSGCGGADDDTPAKVTPAKPGTQPKFVCEQPKITLDPVWQGEPLVFKFNVRNDGDADLRLKIKGG